MKLKWTYNRKNKTWNSYRHYRNGYMIYKTQSGAWMFTLIQTTFKYLESAKQVANLIENG
jgi:hypothetical protein